MFVKGKQYKYPLHEDISSLCQLAKTVSRQTMDFSKNITSLGVGEYTPEGAGLVAAGAVIFVLSCLVLLSPRDKIPVINKYPYDWLSIKAQIAFVTNADGLIKEGFAKVRQCFPSPSSF
jgi:hypothetical protein